MEILFWVFIAFVVVELFAAWANAERNTFQSVDQKYNRRCFSCKNCGTENDID